MGGRGGGRGEFGGVSRKGAGEFDEWSRVSGVRGVIIRERETGNGT